MRVYAASFSHFPISFSPAEMISFFSLYSLAVGVKMNILLFAPAIFLAYISTGGLIKAVKQVLVCGLVQLAIGFPFLTTYPLEYLKGSFDIGRVFLFEWTVNWRFVPEEIFVHKGFHITLLLAHALALTLFARKWWAMLQNYNRYGAAGELKDFN